MRVKVDASKGPIAVGDLLVTSALRRNRNLRVTRRDGPGYLVKQSDDPGFGGTLLKCEASFYRLCHTLPAAAPTRVDGFARPADLAETLVVQGVLDELAGFAPVHAVLGNNDRDLFGVLTPAHLSVVLLVTSLCAGIVHLYRCLPRMRAQAGYVVLTLVWQVLFVLGILVACTLVSIAGVRITATPLRRPESPHRYPPAGGSRAARCAGAGRGRRGPPPPRSRRRCGR